jgi:hypothetical protein
MFSWLLFSVFNDVLCSAELFSLERDEYAWLIGNDIGGTGHCLLHGITLALF